MTAYYNEFDPFAAEWLRALIAAGHIAPGDVDTRSIVDVRPDDLKGYTQCHFFAGIGVWSYALRQAGWSDDRPVWTGSCPCQPFSAAGKGGGFDDERHLWPHFHWLIDQCQPATILGEQVASKDGLAWIDLVQADLEGSGYASGAVDTCAAGFGSPNIRQRLYWMAYTELPSAARQRSDGGSREAEAGIRGGPADCGKPLQLAYACGERFQIGSVATDRCGGMADTNCAGRSQQPEFDGEPLTGREASQPRGHDAGRGDPGGMADAAEFGRVGRRAGGAGNEPGEIERSARLRATSSGPSAAGPTNGLWRDADWLYCRDGKWRPVEPGTFPLAHGAPARVGRLRGYGNAINAQQAQGFIEAYLETKAIEGDGYFRLTDLSGFTTDNTLQEDIFG